MAITLTRNLKLKVDSNFDDTSKYNLNKIDTLASIFQINTNEQAIVRSKTSINLAPNSADIGGTGIGGEVLFGSADQMLDSITFYATAVSFPGGAITLSDTATGGTKTLALQYKSDISGAVDTTADRILNFDLQGADRNIVLSGDFHVVGSDFKVSFSALTNGDVLTYNSSTQKWENQDPSSASSSELAVSWIPGDGAVKTITHGFNSRNVEVQIFDENYLTIEVDAIERTTVNTLTLTSSNTPTGTWTVLIKKLGA